MAITSKAVRRRLVTGIGARACRVRGITRHVAQVAHTAGLSPVASLSRSDPDRRSARVALVLDEFGAVVAPGGAGLVIASMAGHMFPPLTAEQEHALAHSPLATLWPDVRQPAKVNAARHRISNRQRQPHSSRAASAHWAERGARGQFDRPGISDIHGAAGARLPGR